MPFLVIYKKVNLYNSVPNGYLYNTSLHTTPPQSTILYWINRPIIEQKETVCFVTVGLVGQIVGGAAIAMAGNAAQQGIDIAKGKRTAFDTGEMLIDGAIGAVCGLAGGSGASQGNSKTAVTLGKQLSKRIFKTGEVKKAFAKSGLTGLGINSTKSMFTR